MKFNIKFKDLIFNWRDFIFNWRVFINMILSLSVFLLSQVISTKTQSGDSLLIHLVNVVNKLMTQQEKMEKMLKTQEQSLLIHNQKIRQIQNDYKFTLTVCFV